jgi:predicted ATPase
LTRQVAPLSIAANTSSFVAIRSGSGRATKCAAPSAEVEAHLQQSLAIARRQAAKSLELRTTMSLCRLWQQQGQYREAQAMLAVIYDWFGEGFDTCDLIEARSLLTELTSLVVAD